MSPLGLEERLAEVRDLWTATGACTDRSRRALARRVIEPYFQRLSPEKRVEALGRVFALFPSAATEEPASPDESARSDRPAGPTAAPPSGVEEPSRARRPPAPAPLRDTPSAAPSEAAAASLEEALLPLVGVLHSGETAEGRRTAARAFAADPVRMRHACRVAATGAAVADFLAHHSAVGSGAVENLGEETLRRLRSADESGTDAVLQEFDLAARRFLEASALRDRLLYRWFQTWAPAKKVDEFERAAKGLRAETRAARAWEEFRAWAAREGTAGALEKNFERFVRSQTTGRRPEA